MRAVVIVVALAACSGKSALPTSEQQSLTGQQALTASLKDVPGWFGQPTSPARKISGQLLDGEQPIAGTVHLRIAAPDATVWTGIDLNVGVDGRFDFGALRAARYKILAMAPGKTSRVVDIDTRSADATGLAIYANGCTATTSTIVTEDGKPVSGAQVDIDGVVIATTDVAGKFSVCLNMESMVLTVRAVGYAAQDAWAYEGRIVRDAVLAPTIEVRGRVVAASGAPMAGVAVQPVYVEQVQLDHGSAYGDIPVQATTDGDGRFVLRGIPKLDRATGFGDRPERAAEYYFRVIDRDAVFEDRDARVDTVAPTDVVVHMVKKESEPERTKPWGADATISGRVLHDGKPLPDAIVNNLILNERTFPTRTKSDGTFELAVRGGGRLMLQVEHASGLSTERIVEVASGQHLTDLVIDVASTGKLQGVVVDGSGKPLDKVQLWVVARDAPMRRYAYTGADGAFSIDVEVGHMYELKATDGRTGVSAEQDVKLEADGAATGLKIVLGGARQLEGIVVDVRGIAVAGATVLANEPTFQRLANGSSRAKAAWIPKGAAVRSISGLVGSTLFALDDQTDASGRFTWSPRSDGPYSIMVIGPDGRIGVADNLTVADSPVRFTLRRSGSLHVICNGFRPMGGSMEDMSGGVAIVRAQRRLEVGCDETIGDMPEGRYLVTAKADAFKFASAEVDVRPGATATAKLEVKAAGTIHGTVVSYPGDKPLAGFECNAGIDEGGGQLVAGDPGARTSADGTFELKVSAGKIVVTCEDPQHLYADGAAEVELAGRSNAIVRMVRIPTDGIHLGVKFEAVPTGVRLTTVPAIAADAGLRVGDLVRSVDGLSLAGLDPRSVGALAFTPPRNTSPTLSIERDGKPLSITLKLN